MAMSENTRTVLDYLKENKDADLTAVDIADALGLNTKQINGIVTAGLQRKELATRIPAEIELEDGTHKAIKIIKLTEKGLSYNPDEEDAE